MEGHWGGGRERLTVLHARQVRELGQGLVLVQLWRVNGGGASGPSEEFTSACASLWSKLNKA